MILGARQGQGPELVDHLVAEPERLARGHQHRDARCGQQRRHDRRGVFGELLEVVQDDDRRRPAGEQQGRLHEHVGGGVTRDRRDRERPGDRGTRLLDGPARREVDEHDRLLVLAAPRVLADEARLAHAGGTVHGDQPLAEGLERREAREVGGATDETQRLGQRRS